MSLTSANKNASDFIIRCAASGLFLNDATSDFETVAVTLDAKKALVLSDGAAAEKGCKFMSALYPYFDWRAVERDLYVMPVKKAA